MSEAPEPGKTPSPMRYAGLGIQLAVSILVFVFLGMWADRRAGTNGLFTILGAFVGFGGTMWGLIRSLNKGDRGE